MLGLFLSQPWDRGCFALLLSWVVKGQWCCSVLGGSRGSKGKLSSWEKMGVMALSLSHFLPGTGEKLKTALQCCLGKWALDLLPQRQGRRVQKFMQTCGETTFFVFKTLPRLSSAHEVSLGYKCLGCLDLSWNILWVLLKYKLPVPWSWLSWQPCLAFLGGRARVSAVWDNDSSLARDVGVLVRGACPSLCLLTPCPSAGAADHGDTCAPHSHLSSTAVTQGWLCQGWPVPLQSRWFKRWKT